MTYPGDTPVPRALPAPASDRSRAVAVTLGAVVGIFGGHRYYAGKIGTGILQTCTFGGLGIWWLYDMVLLVSGQFADAEGRKISQWAPTEIAPPGVVNAEQLEGLYDEMERLRGEITDLHERIDFHERLLQKARDTGH